MLNGNCLLELLLSDEYLLDIIGCLEYDPELLVVPLPAQNLASSSL